MPLKPKPGKAGEPVSKEQEALQQANRELVTLRFELDVRVRELVEARGEAQQWKSKYEACEAALRAQHGDMQDVLQAKRHRNKVCTSCVELRVRGSHMHAQ